VKLELPRDLFQDVRISRENSIINLWIQEPFFSVTSSAIEFSGGIQRQEGGFKGTGELISVSLTAAKPGIFRVNVPGATVLAHDGRGTDVTGKRTGTVLHIREKGRPTPDLNGDGTINLLDAGVFVFNLGRPYNSAYDLNQDSKVNWADFDILRSLHDEF